MTVAIVELHTDCAVACVAIAAEHFAPDAIRELLARHRHAGTTSVQSITFHPAGPSGRETEASPRPIQTEENSTDAQDPSLHSGDAQMAIVASKTAGADFELPEPGAYPARCFRVIDLGSHMVEFQGTKKTRREIRLYWELLGDERMDDGRPFSVSKKYTLSLDDRATLRRDLEAWRRKPFSEGELAAFDVAKLAGAPCLLSIVHVERNGKTYANVGSLMPLPKGTPKPAGVNDVQVFDLSEPDVAVFDALSESMKSYIQESPEFKAWQQASKPAGAFDDLPSDKPWEDVEEVAF